jgi:hypothetical protein
MCYAFDIVNWLANLFPTGSVSERKMQEHVNAHIWEKEERRVLPSLGEVLMHSAWSPSFSLSPPTHRGNCIGRVNCDGGIQLSAG